MTAHCAAELLSAYVDAELAPRQVRRVEDHLAVCEQCRQEVAELGRLVDRLHSLERLAPPPVLAAEVERRVVLEAGRDRLGRRIDRRMQRWSLEPAVGLGFALVVTFTVVLFLFAQGVERARDRTIPLRFVDAPAGEVLGAPVGEGAAGVREVAGRRFTRVDGGWRQDGAPAGADGRHVLLGGREWRRLVAAHPELAEVVELPGRVLLLVDGEAVELTR
ncbi:MAG TPA: zf-HC2 domain-containing protein [Thermoanaerobaculia bacterium]|nr:zf-HC2 domain-containing protein [Thermoanaerobaculia bacterium]